MKSQPFGLDIGVTSMKAVWLTHVKDSYLLSSSYTLPTPVRGMSSESPLDQEEMAKAIARVAKEAKITSPFVNIAFPENQVYTKVIDMPVLSDKELSSAITWEAEQYIPVPLATITFDYKVLKKPDRASVDNQMQVLLVGAPTALIDKYQKITSMAGFRISAVETEILSTIRALVVGDKFPSTLIVNIGAHTTSLAIIKDGIIIFTYSIALGGSAISRAIAADFGFTIAQAEEYKKTYGVSEKSFEGKIGRASEPILTSILLEVKKAITFYTEKYKSEGTIQQILLSGGSAKLPGINLYFAKASGIETVVANPWKILGNQQLPKEIQENAPDYTIAVGLAMREYE